MGSQGTSYLVEGNNKGSFPLLQDRKRLEGLGLQPVHNVHHQNGYVTHGGTPHTQVAGGVKGGGGQAKEEGRNRIKEGILVQTVIVHSCFFHHPLPCVEKKCL